VDLVVNAPVERVFDFISDLDRHLQWITGLTYVSRTGKLEVGMEYLSKNSALGRELIGQQRVLRVEPNRAVEIESRARPLESVIEFNTTEFKGSTRVSATLLVRSDHPVFGLARPLLESLMTSRLEGDLRNLKALVEAAV